MLLVNYLNLKFLRLNCRQIKNFNHHFFYSNLFTDKVSLLTSKYHVNNMNGQQGNPEENLQDQFHKNHRNLFSRVDYIAGENVRDSNGKFKCGLRVDEDFNGDIDFALA